MAIDSDVATFYDTFANPHGSYASDELYFDGTYWQLGYPERTRQIKEKTHSALLTKELGKLTLQDFEAYVGLDWLQPHGAIETTFKHSRKLIEEERMEFLKENTRSDLWHKSAVADDIDSEKRQKLFSEAGDMWWYATALGIATRVGLAESWQTSVRRQGLLASEWSKARSLTEIHDAIESGFVPRLGASQPGDIEVDISLFSVGLVTNAAIGYLEQINDESGINEESLVHVQRNAMLGLGHMTGLVALYAQKLGGSIVDVARINMQKTMMRAQRRTLEDKTARSSDEL